jgi:hypothetical protein
MARCFTTPFHCLGFATRAAQTVLIVVVNYGEYRSKRLNQVPYFHVGIRQRYGYFPGARIDGPEVSRLGEAIGCARFARMSRELGPL